MHQSPWSKKKCMIMHNAKSTHANNENEIYLPPNFIAGSVFQSCVAQVYIVRARITMTTVESKIVSPQVHTIFVAFKAPGQHIQCQVQVFLPGAEQTRCISLILLKELCTHCCTKLFLFDKKKMLTRPVILIVYSGLNKCGKLAINFRQKFKLLSTSW